MFYPNIILKFNPKLENRFIKVLFKHSSILFLFEMSIDFRKVIIGIVLFIIGVADAIRTSLGPKGMDKMVSYFYDTVFNFTF